MTGKYEAPDPTPRDRPEATPTSESDRGAASDAPAGARQSPGTGADAHVSAAPGGADGADGADARPEDDRPNGDSAADAGQSRLSALDLSEIGSFLSGSKSDELKGVIAERDEYLDSLRRLQADFDNYRKRAIRQQTELVERATEGLLLRLLPVLDALDLAMAHLPAAGEGSDSDAMKSLTQIGTLLTDVLEREGLERIDKVDVRFDPTIHDAVAQAGPSDEPESGEAGEGSPDRDVDSSGDDETAGSGTSGANSVASVMRSGYRLKGHVLRPAMVAVRS